MSDLQFRGPLRQGLPTGQGRRQRQRRTAALRPREHPGRPPGRPGWAHLARLRAGRGGPWATRF
eukprot:15463550-Alexandrium_andersonii.AAC.1